MRKYEIITRQSLNKPGTLSGLGAHLANASVRSGPAALLAAFVSFLLFLPSFPSVPSHVFRPMMSQAVLWGLRDDKSVKYLRENWTSVGKTKENWKCNRFSSSVNKDSENDVCLELMFQTRRELMSTGGYIRSVSRRGQDRNWQRGHMFMFLN